MAVSMLLGLYTMRLILSALGVVDYGIYNVVGGVVAMCSIISNTLSSASQRFFSYEIGQNNKERLQVFFSATVIIYVLFSLFIIVLAETIGFWFVKNCLDYPVERELPVIYVYQFSIFSFVVTILRVPYNSMIIAEEKMAFWAWLTVVEMVLKLIVALALLYITFDRLICYAFFIFLITFLVSIGYYIYCRIEFEECALSLVKDNAIYKSLLSFAGWNLLGSTASVALDQGLNIVLNIFFGPAVNAARAVGYSVKNYTAQFASNVQMASIPQIIKYYSSGDNRNFELLLYRSSKISFFFLYTISLPLILNVDYILNIWLGNVPEWTSQFTILALIITLVECLSGTIIPAIQATGNVKWYNILIGSTFILSVPIACLLFYLGFSPLMAMVVPIFLGGICLVIRMFLLQQYVGIPLLSYSKNVLAPDILVVIVSVIIPVIFSNCDNAGNFLKTFISVLISLSSTTLTCYYLGFSKTERKTIDNLVSKKISIWKEQLKNTKNVL